MNYTIQICTAQKIIFGQLRSCLPGCRWDHVVEEFLHDLAILKTRHWGNLSFTFSLLFPNQPTFPPPLSLSLCSYINFRLSAMYSLFLNVSFSSDSFLSFIFFYLSFFQSHFNVFSFDLLLCLQILSFTKMHVCLTVSFLSF